MKSCQATWEDAENNRHVELVVNHRLDATRVEINDVTPTRVTFLCPTIRKPAPLDRRLDRRRPPRARPTGLQRPAGFGHAAKRSPAGSNKHAIRERRAARQCCKPSRLELGLCDGCLCRQPFMALAPEIAERVSTESSRPPSSTRHLDDEPRFERGRFGARRGRVAFHGRVALRDLQIDRRRQLNADALAVVNQRQHAL